MTAPSSAAADLIPKHEAAALALEAAAVAATTGALTAALAEIVAWVHLQWAVLFLPGTGVQAGPAFDTFTGELAGKLRGLKLPSASTLTDFAQQARDLGVEQGLSEADRLTDELLAELTADIAEETQRAADAAVEDARRKVATAAALADALAEGRLSDVEATITPAQQAANSLARAAATAVQTELNRGLAASIAALGGRSMWWAERDACVACLAQHGQLADDDGLFDWTKTFGDKAYPVKAYSLVGVLEEIPLEHPPRHPWCRCRLVAWFGDTPGPADVPTVLRREAERSVLAGFALPSESEAVRTHAADNLLRLVGDTKNSRSPSGWQVPQSVKDRARKALSKGTFRAGPVPKGRD